MKNYLLLFASAALLLTGCAKENLAGGQSNEGMAKVTFTTTLDNVAATKAAADNDGAAANVNRCIMEIYYGDELFARQYAKVTDKKATFTALVASNRTYKIAFWADKVEDPSSEASLAIDNYYTTTSLKEISLAGSYVGNNDARDAFYACEDFTVGQAGGAFEATLKRPFAQMNVITTDWNIANEVAGLKPEKVVVTFKNALVNFNVLAEEASGSGNIEYEAETYGADAHEAEKTLSMDYLFASVTKETMDIEWKALHGNDAEVKHEFTAVPYQRNYRTNIKGMLLTAKGQWNVDIDSDWDGDGTSDVDPWLYNYVVAGSIAAANEALKSGNNAVSIENPQDLGTDIVLPAEQDGNSVAVKIEGAADGSIKIVLGEGAEGPAELQIESDSKDLDINCPKTHVGINTGAYEAVTATTSATTLVIGRDVTVETLDIKKGNVEIHGKVNNLIRANGVKAEMYASDRATLVNYIKWANSGDVAGLETDIDLAGENWTPAHMGDNNFVATFDGCGHSIENMKVILDASTGTPYGGGFFYSMNGTMKNVTFVNAEVKSTVDGKGNVFGVAAGYAYGAVTFENINVKDSKVSAFGKVAGILGMAAEPGTHVTTMKDCSLENVELIGTYNVANYIGLLQNNVEMTGCSSTNVEKKLSVRYGEDTYVTFENVKVINNDAQNPKYVLSSGKYWKNGTDYYSAFAEYYNDEKYSGWKALDGEVDGIVFNTTDVPELKDLEPVATIGSTKYYDFPTALAALQSGQTLEILQAGEYTVETLSTPANTTIDAKVDGVVFNHTPGSGCWVASGAEGRTVKNITWNVGTANYQYFHGVNLVNCKVNGLLCTHTNNTYTDCEFYNADDYNFWDYGTGSTFIGCKFTCPGGTKGGVINAYNEGQQGMKAIVLKDCEFVALEQSGKYAAIYIKPETDFDVQFTNCTANDKFCTGDISGSKLWNVKSVSNKNTKVTVDGKLVYANGIVMAITTAAQLQAFSNAVNAGTTFEGKTVYLDADVDLAGTEWIPAANSISSYPGVGFFGTFEGQGHTIKNMSCSADTESYAAAGFIGAGHCTIKDLTLENVNVSSTHYAGAFVGYASAGITLSNCNLKGGSVVSTPELIGTEYDNGDKVGGLIGYGSDGCSVTNCTVEGVTIKAYRDLGGIAGAIGGTITNCTVKNSSIIQDNTNAYKTGIDTYHEILGRDLGATLNGNTFENVTVESIN